MAAIPSTAGIPFTPIPFAGSTVGFMTTDETSRTRAKQTMMSDEMTGHPSNDSTLYASRCLGRAR
jgi:hypothetical protein